MLYSRIKIFIRLALKIFCKTIIVRNEQFLQSKGPLLLTANHPNALMDAIVIGALFNQPVHFLTRGDVFNTPWKRKLLGKLNMIPIYRIRDGYENLHLNQYAFDKSHAVLKGNGIVLIFIEGACKHTHELQPFKKGAARIAFTAWKENIPLQVMPISIRYNSLLSFGKKILINIVPAIQQEKLKMGSDEPKNFLHFNKLISDKLSQQLKEEIKESNKPIFPLLIPAMIGKLVHAPLYYPIKSFVSKKTNGNEFYDSVLFGLLFFIYPIYLLLISLIVLFLTKHGLFVMLVFILLPILAWTAVRNKI